MDRQPDHELPAELRNLSAEHWQQLQELAEAFGTDEVGKLRVQVAHYKQRCDAYEERYHDAVRAQVRLGEQLRDNNDKLKELERKIAELQAKLANSPRLIPDGTVDL